VARLGGGQDAELRHVRDADDHEARLAQPPHHEGVVDGAVAGEQGRGHGHGAPGHRHVGLDGDRHPREGSVVTRLHRVGLGERALGVDFGEGVDLPVEAFDALERRRHQLARRGVAGTDQASELDHGAMTQVVHRGRLRAWWRVAGRHIDVG
jgi:hypothetical protein